jgi:antitoxin (DNA-binding transcriptional repressor) of toxin-antitoxin stability system
MTTFTVHAAKTALSQLIARAEAGEEIILARGKLSAVRLTPIQLPPTGRRFGSMRGIVSVGDSFFDQLPENELAGWE